MDEWSLSIAATAAGAGVVIAGIFATRRRRRVAMGEITLLPWNSIMLVGMVAAVFGAVHLLTLWNAR